jgi:serine/threonine protein phosphatase 1
MLKRLFSRSERLPRLPPGVRIYAIGDIHGRADLLREAFALIDRDIACCGAERVIQVFLGDYVDRGSDACLALDLLIDRARDHEAVFLRGNHEQLLLDFLTQPAVLPEWWSLGGAATLMSYGIAPIGSGGRRQEVVLRDELASAMPGAHRSFLASLLPAFSCGDFFFTHAGVRPGVALDLQDEQDLMWIREPFLSCHEDFGKVVVHGHTPVREPEVHGHRINIDTGAYATGCLTVLSIEDGQYEFHPARRG